MLLIGIILTLTIVVASADGYTCDTNVTKNLEEQLKASLFCEYDTSFRPVKKQASGIVVKMSVIVRRIATVEESSTLSPLNSVTIHSLTLLTWMDEYLKWHNIEKYKDILTVMVPTHKVWMPNIVMEGFDTRMSSRDFVGNCILFYDGLVICGTFTAYKAYCNTDFSRWPYDSMTCSTNFRVWMKSGEVVNLTMMAINGGTEEMLEKVNKKHHNWKLKSMDSTYHSPSISFLNLTYPSIEYSYVLERHTATWAALIIGPVLVMMSLTLVSYLLDIGSMERISLLGMGFMCHFFYLLQLTWYIPANGNTCPLLVLFVRGSIILNFIAILETLVLRFLENFHSESVKVVVKIMGTQVCKILMFKGFQQMDEKEETSSANNGWRTFAMFLNRLFVVVALVVYAAMFLAMVI